MKNIKNINFFILSIFGIILLFGILTYKDYGTSIDETIERYSSLVSYYNIKAFFHGKKVENGIPVLDSNSSIEKLFNREKYYRSGMDYPYKYYGVAIQLPMVLIEELNNFSLSNNEIYNMRHLFTYIIYFCSLIYLYLIFCKYIIKNKYYAILAVIFMALSPRIYGEAFYNIKDSIFASLCLINLYFCFRYINSNKWMDLIILAFISAITINCRIIGGIFVFCALLFKLYDNKNNNKKIIKDSLLISIITFLFYIIITPMSWDNPIIFPFETMKFFYNYVDPFSKIINICFYFGKVYSSNSLPWHYVPVWIFITTPLLYIVFFFIGIISKIKDIIKTKLKDINKELLFCNVILFSILIFFMITRPTLYGGWRHLYFLYSLIIIDSIVGVQYIMNIHKKAKYYLVSIIIINFFFLILWMIKNHPYQYEYYSYPIRDYVVENFSINYWQVSNKDAFNYILNDAKEKDKIYVYLPDNRNQLIQLNIEGGYKIVLEDEISSTTDYIIDNSCYENITLSQEYKEIYSKKIDQKYRLFTIYKIKKEMEK